MVETDRSFNPLGPNVLDREANWYLACNVINLFCNDANSSNN